MLSLTDFLEALPGIKPRKTRKLIIDTDEILSPSEKADLHERQSYYETVIEVGPVAATAILAAYKNSQLPMQSVAPPVDAPIAEAYLAKRNELLFQIAERNRRRRAVEDPLLVVEGDLTDHYFIDQVFIHNVGTGGASMTLAGIVVSKSLTAYPSNSGKSRGWAVHFSWIGSDGQRHSSGGIPPEANNRRNDPMRNWGFPE